MIISTTHCTISERSERGVTSHRHNQHTKKLFIVCFLVCCLPGNAALIPCRSIYGSICCCIGFHRSTTRDNDSHHFVQRNIREGRSKSSANWVYKNFIYTVVLNGNWVYCRKVNSSSDNTIIGVCLYATAASGKMISLLHSGLLCSIATS